MQARLLLGKIEEPVQTNNRNGGSSQIQEPRQSRRQPGGVESVAMGTISRTASSGKAQSSPLE
jgi:hypothetical protein